MPIHHFTLIAGGTDLQSESTIDALFEAGCDDATVGLADGVQYLDFDREAQSLGEAIFSAVRDVEQLEGVYVTRVADAGLVSMADIAARLGRTRESVRLLVTGARGPGCFPAPITDPRSRYRLWRWSDVSHWLITQLGDDTMTADHVVTALNASLELRRHLHELSNTARNSLRVFAGFASTPRSRLVRSHRTFEAVLPNPPLDLKKRLDASLDQALQTLVADFLSREPTRASVRP